MKIPVDIRIRRERIGLDSKRKNEIKSIIIISAYAPQTKIASVRTATVLLYSISLHWYFSYKLSDAKFAIRRVLRLLTEKNSIIIAVAPQKALRFMQTIKIGIRTATAKTVSLPFAATFLPPVLTLSYQFAKDFATM